MPGLDKVGVREARPDTWLNGPWQQPLTPAEGRQLMRANVRKTRLALVEMGMLDAADVDKDLPSLEAPEGKTRAPAPVSITTDPDKRAKRAASRARRKAARAAGATRCGECGGLVSHLRGCPAA